MTERGGGDADTWADVSQFLPLLRQKQYYSTVRHGFARGTEPVYYVNTIYRYANILEWYAWQKEMEQNTLIAKIATANENMKNIEGLEGIAEALQEVKAVFLEEGVEAPKLEQEETEKKLEEVEIEDKVEEVEEVEIEIMEV